MGTNLYIAEGETEKNFITQLKQKQIVLPGQFKKYNLMRKKLKETDDILTKKRDKIFGIVDTDCDNINCACFKNFEYNIKKLKKIGKIFILVQDKEFEDELKRIFNDSKLSQIFNAKYSNKSDIKKHLCKPDIYENLLLRNQLTSDMLNKYCSHSCHFINTLKTNNITSLSKHVKDFKIIATRK
ncbi:hypothetical protein [Pectinatus frisingensis]|uniref:hypothetical protein n=1 Tax=Pectinatus frisingensis TaxID=865 RepID=UPI0018C80A91|nr:hypothetical protein [Pectinatus frisingensis]